MEIYYNKVDDLLKWKAHCLGQIFEFAKPSRVAELGCGSGFAIETIAEYFPEDRVIGMDRDARRLASLKSIPGVYPVCGDIRSACLRDECVDTALIISTLHEVYSQSGEIGVHAALFDAARILKADGRLIIYDRVKPRAQRTMFDFLDPDLRIRFMRFAKDFRMRKVEYVEEGSKILLDIADAFEFIERFALENGDAWYTNLGETNLFFTREEYARACMRAGMNVTRMIIWRENHGTPENLLDRLIMDVIFRREWIGLAAEKSEQHY